MVLAASHKAFSDPVVLRDTAGSFVLRVQGCHLLWRCFPGRTSTSTSDPVMQALQPRYRRNDIGLGCSPFARHYLGNHYCFLFLRVLRCFSSPGALHIPMYSARMMTWSSTSRVAPFGHPRIKACLQLPVTYRSLSRPSSPAHAKASTMRPNLLKSCHFTWFGHKCHFDALMSRYFVYNGCLSDISPKCAIDERHLYLISQIESMVCAKAIHRLLRYGTIIMSMNWNWPSYRRHRLSRLKTQNLLWS